MKTKTDSRVNVFNTKSGHYAEELAVAYLAWHAATNQNVLPKNPRKWIRDWLDKNCPDLSDRAKDRISKLCDWKRKP